ncbi:MAG: histidine--tRNA ligase [bacterium]|nr:histidine--tRNA ligase [bacterium]
MPKQFKKSTDKNKRQKFAFKSPKGMHDILPDDQFYWERLSKYGKDVAEFYGYHKIETPILEDAEVFLKTLGEESDVVEKEMFFVKGGGKDKYVLRPEGTAPVARAFIEYGMSHRPQPVKLWYSGPMFRKEQPQAGRFRQFHQIGFEIIGGSIDPIYDAQIILASFHILEQAKIKNLVINVNSIGCRICRPHYRKKLIEYYKKNERDLCVDCKRRLKTNPLRLLDCKNANCAPLKVKAPSLLDNICVSCSSHLKLVLEYLDELSLPYVLNPHLVRGLDYYSKTVFEIFTDQSPLALASGGRYDYLLETMGSRPTPGTGSAIGMERVIELMRATHNASAKSSKEKVFFVYLGDLAKKKVLKLIEEFRRTNIITQESFGKDLIKRQMMLADKSGAQLALILGQREVFEETIIIRDLKSGVQETIPITKVVDVVKKRLQ